MADLFLCCGCVLELCRCRYLRVSHQSSGSSVLYARPEHDPSAWAHRTVWRLRLAWPRPHALLSAWTETWSRLEGKTDRMRVLGHQYRSDLHGAFESAANWLTAGVGLR